MPRRDSRRNFSSDTEKERVFPARGEAPLLRRRPSVRRERNSLCVRLQTKESQRGRQLVQATIGETKRLFPDKVIQIQAQAYLKEFYASFGFKPISDVYLEDNIPHLDMVLD